MMANPIPTIMPRPTSRGRGSVDLAVEAVVSGHRPVRQVKMPPDRDGDDRQPQTEAQDFLSFHGRFPAGGRPLLRAGTGPTLKALIRAKRASSSTDVLRR